MKTPLNIKAAVELELRRRQRVRAATCWTCGLLEAIDEIYGEDDGEGRPEICDHRRDQQVPDPQMLSNIELIYG